MICTKNRMRLCIGLLLLNVAFIWGNSLLPGELSGALSRWLQTLLSFGEGQGGTGHGLLRKLAHFTEFACLGMLLTWLTGMLGKKPWLPLTLGVAVACVDETIQKFVPDRGPSLGDVAIDSLGVCLGIGLLLLGHKIRSKQGETP